MSVPLGRRGEQSMNVVTKAIALSEYTLTVTKNEKLFPKRDRWVLTQRIVNTALDITTNVRKANSIRVITKEDYILRRQCQTEAHASCEVLLTLIELAFRVLSLPAQKVEYWTKLIVEEEELLSKWRRSDRERYKDV